MHSEPNTLTRRESLLCVLKGTVAASLAVPLVGSAEVQAFAPEPEFVPENDYPFFGYEPDSLA